MSEDYDAIRRFIRSEILEPGLQINHLDITRSAIRSITERFEGLGWSVKAVDNANGRHLRHLLTAPDGEQALSMLGGKVYRHSNTTEQICQRKHLTKRMLDLGKVPTAIGGDFSPREKAIATTFFQKMPKPVVVKPTSSGGSYGVTVGVTEQVEFEEAWEYALADGRGSSNVLVEEFLRGVELRAFVIGDEVASVLTRVQPYIVGDGRSTVKDLVEKLHEAREVHYRAKKLPLVVEWQFLNKEGYTEASVADVDEIVFLSPFSLPNKGAFTIDITSVVPDEIKDIARRAKNAIPELEIAGVDLLVEDVRDASTAHVLEVNTAASIDMHRYPTHGNPRAIDEDIVDYFHSTFLAESEALS